MYLEHFAKGIIDFQHIHAPSSNNKFFLAFKFQLILWLVQKREAIRYKTNQFVVSNQTYNVNLCFILNSIPFDHCIKEIFLNHNATINFYTLFLNKFTNLDQPSSSQS